MRHSRSPKYYNVDILPVQACTCQARWQLSRGPSLKQTAVLLREFHSLFLDMLPAGLGDGYHPTRSSSRSSIPSRGEACDHLRLEGKQIPAEPPTQARNTRTRIWPSAARTFLQRTLARVLRQPKHTSQRALVSPPRRALALDKGPLSEPSDTSSCLTGRDHFASLTPLVLQRTDDVAFSPSSFFRRVEEIRALGSGLDDPLVSSQLLPQRRPPFGPHRRPPPPVGEASDRSMTCTSPLLSRNPTSSRPQTTLRRQPPRSELCSVLGLQALAMELDKLDPLPVKSPPPLVPQCLQTSPSIKSLHHRPRPWSTSPLEARNHSCDPLAELLAVADELKTMKNLDSDDILYMTDAPPPSPLPPTLHAFLDAPGSSLRILEMDVHREDETFLGVPIPCIVVTSERDSLPKAKLEIHGLPPLSSEDLLAPPPATYRGRVETDQPPIITNGDSERSPFSPTWSPSPTLPSCDDTADGDEVTGGSLSPPCYCPACALGDGNLSWKVIGMAPPPEPSTQCTKPGRPTTPKPTPLLRRHERSLLRRMLGGGDGCNPPLVEKDMSGCIPSKRKRKRISKDEIGSPRPLSLVGQVT